MPIPMICCDTQAEGHNGRWIRCCRNPCRGSPLDDWESLKLSPFQKWKIYGMPPWKCLMSFLLVVLTTCQVWSLNRYIIPYKRAAKQNWQVYLVEPDIYAEPYGYGVDLMFRIYEISWLVKQVEYSVQQYYKLENKAVGNFIMPRYPNDEIIPPLLTMQVYMNEENELDKDKSGSNLETELYNLTVSDLGPFSKMNETELSSYIRATSYFRIDFSVMNMLDYGSSNGYDTCYWNGLMQKYSFTWRGRIDLSVIPSVKICQDEFDKSWFNRDVGFNIILIMLILIAATISEILLFKSIYRHITLFQRFKEKVKDMQYGNDLKRWKEFFNLWFFISTVANIFDFVAAALCLKMFLGAQGEDSTWKAPLAFTGLACMFSWFALVQFFEHFPKYYSLILTLRISAPKVARFVLGAAPVFFGFAMFGVAMFSSYSELFKDLGAASVTLFALLNGDVIHDVFTALLPAGPLISRGYLYLFISMFIYAVLNIFIAIVEDSYFTAKRNRKVRLANAMVERSKGPDYLDVLSLLQGPPIPNHLHDHSKATREVSNVSTYALEYVSSTNLKKDLPVGDLKEPLLKSTFSFNDLSSQPSAKNLVPHKTVQKQQELVEVLDGMQETLNEEFLKLVLTIVSNSSVPVRPAHNPKNFPCDFKDCIYCVLKELYMDSLKGIETSIEEELQREVDRIKDLH